MSLKKDLEDMMRSFGYEVVNRKRHAVWRHRESGHVVYTPATPSDIRGVKNLRALLRRNQRK